MLDPGDFEGLDAVAVADPGPPRLDPILDSPWARSSMLEPEVARWVDVFSSRQGADVRIWMERMERYRPLVDSALEARGLPRSLRYLPMIESGYRPSAVSRASAVGLWQFVAPVAEVHGMEVSPLIDERRDPVLATQGALTFLEDLHGRFGSWFLALAAYNGGPTRVERLLREHAPLALPSDSLFSVIAPHLPRETREYVPRFLAAAQIAENPRRFGLEGPTAGEPWAWDEVEIPDAASLDVVAFAAGVSEDEIRQLNPQIVRGITPRGQAVTLRIPQGRRERFEEAWAQIPQDEWVTVTEHVVAAGETLYDIARQYGVRLHELEGANPQVEPRRMRPGTRLLVPLLPDARRRISEPQTGR
jgi:membrane-bound lytic murein transglycosylase D